jgi:protoporphyrinogen oxidase
MQSHKYDVAIIGAGFTGLAAALDLARAGVSVAVLEAEDDVGGLAGTFSVGQARLEKFYHHWFTNDEHVHQLVSDLGAADQIVYRPTTTGSYYANGIFRLARPLDVLRFTPLSLIGRIRLGLLVLQVRAVKDWRELEGLTALEWLTKLCGKEVVDRVWWPLLKGKFGPFANEVSAVWFWNKLKLRGGSRDASGKESLAYFKGGFGALSKLLAQKIQEAGGSILLNRPATGLKVEGGRLHGIETSAGLVEADKTLATIPLPQYAALVKRHVPESYLQQLAQVPFLGNVCLVLELARALSDYYWLNVTDPEFPFVGVIEHTNFESPVDYAGRHIVYLSKYTPTDAPIYRMSDSELLDFALPYLTRMFPNFRRQDVLNAHAYRAPFSQPVVTRHYSRVIPDVKTPLEGLYLSTMAQIYPEDRGTNYAIREGRRMARELRPTGRH